MSQSRSSTEAGKAGGVGGPSSFLLLPLGHFRKAGRNKGLLAPFGFADHEPGDSGCLLNDRKALFRTQNGDHLGQAIGREAVRRHHGNAAAAHQSKPRMRIDDVRIAFSTDLHVLFGVAGGGNSRIVEQELMPRFAQRIVQRGNADDPGLGIRGRTADHDLTSRNHQGPGQAVLLQDRQDLVGRVTLGYAAQVQLHTRLRQLHRPLLGIEPDLVVAHQGQGLGQLVGFG